VSARSRLLLAAGLTVASLAAAAPEPGAFVALAASVLRVEAPRDGGGFAIGSAVTVGPELVVTNCHVTRDARRINVVRGGVRWPAAAQASELSRDLCLLHVPGLVSPPVAVGRAADLALGQPVTALGYTGGVGIQNSAGEVQGLHRHDGGFVIQSSNWFSSGASGGGLFDDRGQLVGVLTFRLRGGEAHYFAAPAEWVHELVDGAGRGDLRTVLPLEQYPRPYWESAAPPLFLLAARLQREARWPELERLAEQWRRQDPADGEPWYLLGAALLRQGRDDAARQALQCALRLQPGRSAARALLQGLPATAGGSDCPIQPS
jgi:hypothetical protein